VFIIYFSNKYRDKAIYYQYPDNYVQHKDFHFFLDDRIHVASGNGGPTSDFEEDSQLSHKLYSSESIIPRTKSILSVLERFYNSVKIRDNTRIEEVEDV
jgi:hypothetical protein